MRKTHITGKDDAMKSKVESGREWTAQADPKQAREERWEEWRLLHASPEVWTARMLTGLRKGIKGNKWFSLADKVWRVSTLQAAFVKVKKNQGSAGSDGQTIAAFGTNLEANCVKLSEELQSGRYQRQPVKRIMIPKTGGGERPLGIPTVKVHYRSFQRLFGIGADHPSVSPAERPKFPGPEATTLRRDRDSDSAKFSRRQLRGADRVDRWATALSRILAH